MASKKTARKDRTRTDAVRSAVDQAFQATADRAEHTQRLAQERVQDVADELQQIASRLRDTLDDARPATAADVAALREELKSLGSRVAKLETPARKPAARKPAAAKPAARKPAAAKPAAAKPAAAKPAARKPAARTTRATAASKVPAARAAAKRTSS